MATKPDVKIPAGAAPVDLAIEDLVVGAGAEATAGKTVDVHYVGISWSTQKQFDASWDRGSTFSFPLGQGRVIKGWDQGVAGMKVGGRWKGTDLVVGQVNTPTFATPGMSEPTWSYRALERTITDIRRTPSFDLGVTLQGTFDPTNRNYGFDLMVANGSAAKPESDNYKWLYGDLWAKFFDKRVVVQFYADYERLNWLSNWHHSRQMIKGYAAYTTPAFTFGIEAFTNHLQNDNFATKIAGGVDTLSANATGLSIFVHGNIVTNKLRFFARLDTYNPMNIIDNNTYNKYTGNTGNYNDNSYQKAANGTLTATGDQTYKQTFVTAGLDFTPVKGVHFMPNIWYNHHNTQLPGGNADYDLVYRLTFYFVFGK